MMQPMKSSAATHIGHDGKDLHVTYAGGKTYIHAGVPPEIHAQLMEPGASIGALLNRHVRGQYPGKLKPPEKTAR